MRHGNARKILLIGMDGLMPEQIDRYRDDIPELKAFLERGTGGGHRVLPQGT
jgi:predicted AlkP superfamily phosphohydrolase/phosphomutase